MLVTVTFDITTKNQREILFTDIYAYFDIEVTDEEYKKISESCDTGLYRGMYEDKKLSDICARCKEAISKWEFEEAFGDNILFRFDYPLETRIDHAVAQGKKRCGPMKKSEFTMSATHLFQNDDGTYTVWWPGEDD